ncbi:bifunctional DNA primase/polymerase [Actinoplanes sp. CA-030573]|uniref:bifunctional DNA primase/polymerase n=1 Tax=Actinoplanes sp. CA-030573 TaxID=3239898 RepID=UPI003D8C7159
MFDRSGLLAAALGYAARGWHVFPLIPGDKRPACDRWEQRATTDPHRIEACWTSGPYGIGIACGPSRLLVIDLDTPKPSQHPPAEWADPPCRDGIDVFGLLCARHDQDGGGPEVWDTYSVRTGRGGLHLYYRHPDHGPALRNTAGRLGWLIDTRARGGYVVAAPTTVNRSTYQVTRGAAARPLPGLLARLLTPEPPRPDGPRRVLEVPADRRGRYLHAAISRTLDKLGEASEGGRNAALFMAAQSLGQLVAGGALAEQAVADELTGAARRLGLGERETAATIRSGLGAGARRPRQVSV